MLREVRLYCHLLYTQTNQPHLRFTWNIAGIYLLFLCCLWQSAEIDLISYDWKFRFCCYMRVVPQVFRLMYICSLFSPLRAGDALSLSSSCFTFYWFKNGGWDTVGSVWAVSWPQRCCDRKTGAGASLSPLSANLRIWRAYGFDWFRPLSLSG